jgi:hypothetical protein
MDESKNQTYLRKFRTMKIIFFHVLSVIMLAGCSIQPMAPSDFPYELMLQPSDLPAGFTRTGGSFPQVEDGYSHLVGFSSNPDEIGTGIGHQITIYPNIDAAKGYFSDWEKEWFTPAWYEPSIMFTPLDNDDKFRLACMDMQINSRSSKNCTYLQQHNNLIVLVYSNIGDKVLNYDQFMETLKKLDARLPEKDKLIPTPVEWHNDK